MKDIEQAADKTSQPQDLKPEKAVYRIIPDTYIVPPIGTKEHTLKPFQECDIPANTGELPHKKCDGLKKKVTRGGYDAPRRTAIDLNERRGRAPASDPTPRCSPIKGERVHDTGCSVQKIVEGTPKTPVSAFSIDTYGAVRQSLIDNGWACFHGTDKIPDKGWAKAPAVFRDEHQKQGHDLFYRYCNSFIVCHPHTHYLVIDWDDATTAKDAYAALVSTVGPAQLLRQGRPGTFAAIYRCADKPFINSPGKSDIRFDVMTDSGSICLGPEHPDGFAYKWFGRSPVDTRLDELKMTHAEDWNRFFEKVRTHRPTAKSYLSGFAQERANAHPSEFLRVCESQLRRMAPGNRHYTLVSVVGALIFRDFSPAFVRNFVAKHYVGRFGNSDTNRDAKLDNAILSAQKKFQGMN
tara:strand:- start:1317 stop:2540 length:1224 start_codon:yes stop_codon:yes gene_type:complete